MKWCNGLGPNHSNINPGQHPHLDFFCFFFKYSTLKKLQQIRKKLEQTAYSAGSTVIQPEGKCMRCVPTQIIFSKVSIFILCLKTGSMQDIHRLFYYFNYFIYFSILINSLSNSCGHTHRDISGATRGLNIYIYGVAVELIHKPSDS